MFCSYFLQDTQHHCSEVLPPTVTLTLRQIYVLFYVCVWTDMCVVWTVTGCNYIVCARVCMCVGACLWSVRTLHIRNSFPWPYFAGHTCSSCFPINSRAHPHLPHVVPNSALLWHTFYIIPAHGWKSPPTRLVKSLHIFPTFLAHLPVSLLCLLRFLMVAIIFYLSVPLLFAVINIHHPRVTCFHFSSY